MFFSLIPPTYASNQPTTLPPTNPSTSLIVPTHLPHTLLAVTPSPAGGAFGFREFRAWRVESLELEEWKVWKHDLKGKHPIFIFIFSVLVLVCTITNFWQKLAPSFFNFVLLLLGAGGRHHEVLIESQVPLFLFFSLCFVACGLHHQLLVEGEPKFPFFFFLFVAFGCKWVPSPTFDKKGAQAPSFFFFFFFGAYGCRWVPSPSFGRRGTCSPFFCFSFASSWVPLQGLHRERA